MGLGQTFLTVASIALLGIITLTMNSSYLRTNDLMVESEFTIEAVSICESYIERAVGKAFDEMTIISYVGNVGDLTNKSTLGPESGEDSLALFDDYDDFNGYAIKEITDRAEYDVSIEVYYCEDLKPKIKAGGPQWNKKMIVTVNCDYISVPIVMEYIFSYF